MILSIESSCDDSSIAITKIDSYELIYHKKISQELEHSKYGGVVPELASRLHAEALPNILSECKKYFSDLKAIAVTTEPGLSVTLNEGVAMAKALSISLNLPLLPINHLRGHIYSLFIEKPAIFPLTVLLVSGGHTQLIEASSYSDMRVIMSTMDDSFGESFDKVSKMMNMGYPGGPVIEKLALNGDRERFNFTVPLSKSGELAFSYSGLKNQVRLEIEKSPTCDYADIAASFERVAVAHIVQKLKKYFKTTHPRNFAIVGGASANIYLRNEILKLLEPLGCELLLAELKYCSDNSAMIGRVAIEAYHKKEFQNHTQIATKARSSL